MTKHRYIGDRAFYKTALTVALPIMLQNFITNFVNMLDNVMVGALGTEQMSGVSIVNQLTFVFNLAIFGAMGGIGIFTAQYYGKKDEQGIRYTLRIKLTTAVLLTAIGLFIFRLFSEPLISLFLHGDDVSGDIALTMDYAKDYLYLLLPGLIFYAVSQAVADTLRETGDTFTPMITGAAAVVINCIFNYLLIFGKFGFPCLGVKGAAAATVLSRVAECLIIVIYTAVKRERFPYVRGLFRGFGVPKDVFVTVMRKGLPLLFNEVLWSSGMSALSVAFSLHGLAVVAGYSISSTVTNLFYIAFLSMGSAIGIISGKLLGAERYDEAVDTVRKLIVFSLSLSVLMGVAMFAVSGLIPRLYNTDEESKKLAAFFMKVCACAAPLDSFANASYFTLRSGGKTFVTSVFDSGTVWIVFVPTAFALYYFAHLSIWVIFPVVESLYIIKVIVGFILVKKKVWVRTIV